jgi:hypothetical protein
MLATTADIRDAAVSGSAFRRRGLVADFTLGTVLPPGLAWQHDIRENVPWRRPLLSSGNDS